MTTAKPRPGEVWEFDGCYTVLVLRRHYVHGFTAYDVLNLLCSDFDAMKAGEVTMVGIGGDEWERLA